MRVGIPSLPCGNFLSVVKIIEKAGGSAEIVSQPSDLQRFDKLVLAGVGAFDYGMASLTSAGWADALGELVLVKRTPVLGICLGMQLMCDASEEGSLPGLGWISGHVRRFIANPPAAIKIPHMGWNTVQVRKANPLIASTDGEQRFYFVHSYHAVCRDESDVLATTHHGSDVTAAFNRDHIFGVQFHPEKSHRFGLQLMKRFLEVPC